MWERSTSRQKHIKTAGTQAKSCHPCVMHWWLGSQMTFQSRDRVVLLESQVQVIRRIEVNGQRNMNPDKDTPARSSYPTGMVGSVTRHLIRTQENYSNFGWWYMTAAPNFKHGNPNHSQEPPDLSGLCSWQRARVNHFAMMTWGGQEVYPYQQPVGCSPWYLSAIIMLWSVQWIHCLVSVCLKNILN